MNKNSRTYTIILDENEVEDVVISIKLLRSKYMDERESPVKTVDSDMLLYYRIEELTKLLHKIDNSVVGLRKEKK